MINRMTTEQIEAIRNRRENAKKEPWYDVRANSSKDITDLLAEVERLRELMNDLIGTVYSYGTPGESVYEKAEEVDELM